MNLNAENQGKTRYLRIEVFIINSEYKTRKVQEWQQKNDHDVKN